MNPAGQRSLRSQPNGSDIVLDEGHSVERTKRPRRWTDLDLEIAENTFSDEAVRALLDEWIVPTIVESLVHDLMNATLENER
jgi:hypothetical protein